MNIRYDVVKTESIKSAEYQKPVETARVSRIVARFNPAKLGSVLLSDRKDGTYAVVDGQHRLAAVRQMHIDEIHAVILDGLTVEEEADLFRTQSENVVPPKAIDQFRAGIIAKDPHYLTIKAILDKYGYAVSDDSRPYHVRAVGTLTGIVCQHDFAVLDKTFEYIAAAWPADVSAIQRPMLVLIAEFASRYGSKVSAAQFAARMRAEHPSELAYYFDEARIKKYTRKSITNPVVREMGCQILVDAYNKGLGENSRLRLKMERKKVA